MIVIYNVNRWGYLNNQGTRFILKFRDITCPQDAVYSQPKNENSYPPELHSRAGPPAPQPVSLCE